MHHFKNLYLIEFKVIYFDVLLLKIMINYQFNSYIIFIFYNFINFLKYIINTKKLINFKIKYSIVCR
jgi:hypothetical protein